MIKSHKKLSVDSVLKINRAMGMLFSMLQLKMKFSKMFSRIADIMQKNSITENDIKEIQSNSEIEKSKIEIKTSKTNISKIE